MTFKKIFILLLLASFSNSSYANQSVEEIIKGRKAIFSKNYSTAKKVQSLSSSGDYDEAKKFLYYLNQKKLKKPNL